MKIAFLVYKKCGILIVYQIKWLLLTAIVGLIGTLIIALPLGILIAGNFTWHSGVYDIIFVTSLVFGIFGWLYGIGRGIAALDLKAANASKIMIALSALFGLCSGIFIFIIREDFTVENIVVIPVSILAIGYVVYLFISGGNKRSLDWNNIKKEI